MANHQITPEEEQAALRNYDNDSQLLNHILSGDTPSLTKTAMICLERMLKDIA